VNVSATVPDDLSTQLDVVDVLDGLDVPVMITRLPRGPEPAAIAYLNDAMVRLIGGDRNDFIGKPPETLIADLHSDTVNEASPDLRDGRQVTLTRRLRRANGDEITLDTRLMSQRTTTAEYLVEVAQRGTGSRAIDIRDQTCYYDIVLDRQRREVRRAGQVLTLTPTEFELLEVLLDRSECVVSRRELLATVWGFQHETRSHVVDVYVGYLRRKLEAVGPRLIHTVRGAGYILRAPQES